MMAERKDFTIQPFYAVTFTILAGALIWTAIINGGLAWILMWLALSFLIVAAAYGGVGSIVFGKRSDGTRSLWAMVCLFPYLVLLWVIWSVRRLVGHEPCCTQIVPGVWLGRRPYEYELPPQTACVVDLACEFAAAKGVTTKRDYISLPTLDTLIPAETDFLTALNEPPRIRAKYMSIVHWGMVDLQCSLPQSSLTGELCKLQQRRCKLSRKPARRSVCHASNLISLNGTSYGDKEL